LSHALGSSTAVAAAAVLPCFWLYAQVGGEVEEVAADHPYAAWLETYRDPGFVEGVQGALAEVERELAAATPRERSEAADAFLLACRHELEFFEQARRREPGATPADGAASDGTERTRAVHAQATVTEPVLGGAPR